MQSPVNYPTKNVNPHHNAIFLSKFLTAQLLDQTQYVNMTKPQYVNFGKNFGTHLTVISLNCMTRPFLFFTNASGLLSGVVIVSKLT